jgi:hypothetical protein
MRARENDPRTDAHARSRLLSSGIRSSFIPPRYFFADVFFANSARILSRTT